MVNVVLYLGADGAVFGHRKESTEEVTKDGLRYLYTECPRRNGQNFGRVFLMLNYTDITQNTYIQS